MPRRYGSARTTALARLGYRRRAVDAVGTGPSNSSGRPFLRPRRLRAFLLIGRRLTVRRRDRRRPRRLMDRLGVRREVHAVAESLHRSGEWFDAVAYAILASECEGRLVQEHQVTGRRMCELSPGSALIPRLSRAKRVYLRARRPITFPGVLTHRSVAAVGAQAARRVPVLEAVAGPARRAGPR
jgi:hypothetical protein